MRPIEHVDFPRDRDPKASDKLQTSGGKRFVSLLLGGIRREKRKTPQRKPFMALGKNSNDDGGKMVLNNPPPAGVSFGGANRPARVCVLLGGQNFT